MDPELRRVLTWTSRVLSWLSAFFTLVLAVTAFPPELFSTARVPRPYVLGGLDPYSRVLWLLVSGSLTYYLHTTARGLASGTLDHLPRPRMPWEREP